MVASLALALLLQKPSLRPLAERNAQAFLIALRRRDAGWFERTFAPGFTQTVEGRRLDRRAALTQIEGGLRRLRDQRLRVRVLTVRPEGKGYVATVAWRGTEPATLQGKAATLTASWRDEQHWVGQNGMWVLRSLITSKFDRTIE